VGALILDASVVIALLDTAHAHHSRAVDEIEAADVAERPLLLPATAYSEALVAFARAGRIHDGRDAVAAMGIVVAPLTAAMAERAAELRSFHRRLRLPDAIVVACALDCEGELVSYDRLLTQVAGQSDAERRGGGRRRGNRLRRPATGEPEGDGSDT
jgi:predicted nucleic acid-binding protein